MSFDQELEDLISDDEVAEEIKGFSGTETDQLKKDLLGDLYAFSKGVCQYRDVNPRTHGAFCQFIQHHPKKRRLGLMPRTHLKSTTGTIADSLRLGLIDPNEYRGLIVGETVTKGTGFLRELKGHLEKNKVLQALWPEVLPSRFSGPGITWRDDAVLLIRDTAYRQPTWTASGVGGALVGEHYTRIKCDDLIGLDAYRSPAAMAAAVAWVDNIEPLLVDQNSDIIDWIGTRWSVNDLYAHVMEVYEGELGTFVREPIENGEIVFPQKHTWVEYQRIMTKTPLVWHAQYMNNPLAAGGTDFNTSKVYTFRFSLDGTRVEFVDPLTGHEKSWELRELDIVQTCDPNSGSLLAPDTAAISVQGISPDEEVFVLFSWSERKSPSDYVDKIFEVAKRWRPRIVGIEKAGQQTAAHYLEKKTQTEDISFKIEDLKPKNKDKESRIRDNLEPIINGGQLFLLMGQTVLRKQIGDFPQNARYDNALIDELDALAYGPEVWKAPLRIEGQRERTGRIRLLLRKRSRISGY